MKTYLAAAALALASAGPAAAFEFDNATCKTFLAGTWDSEATTVEDNESVVTRTHSIYNPDGTFTSSQTRAVASAAIQSRELKGTWDAKAGPDADSCAATVTIEGMGPMTIVLKVIDENTVKAPTGSLSVRAAR